MKLFDEREIVGHNEDVLRAEARAKGESPGEIALNWLQKGDIQPVQKRAALRVRAKEILLKKCQ